jgi:hypothetical protein
MPDLGRRSKAAASPPLAIVIIDWSPMRRNTLAGFVTARMPSGLVLHDIAIHAKRSTRWASPPSRPRLDRNGAVSRDDAGKILYVPSVSFTARDVRDRFSHQIIEALLKRFPDALSENT